MITKNTVLVLGAGASQPYGFHTGGDLVNGIPAIEDRGTLELAGAKLTEVDQLALEIRRSQPPSIDKFLELRAEFLDVGKLVLASIFLRAEHKSLQEDKFDPGIKDHWYKFLKDRMVGSFDDIGTNKLKIITFNYDRSLEYYLCTTLCSTYGKPADACAEKLAHIPICHVYGSLGPLPWERDKNAVPYGSANITADTITKASQNIKVMHEGSDKDIQRNLGEAQRWLKLADRILFLGFGFHHDNVERLALKEVLQSNQDIRATCQKLNATDKDEAEYCTKWSYRPSHISGSSAIKFPNPEADCCTFLRDHVVLS